MGSIFGYGAHACRLVVLYDSFGWVIESRKWEFRDRSLEIFCLFRENRSFGGKGKGSLEYQLPLINSLWEGWELGEMCS
jgi:hypothetical protein